MSKYLGKLLLEAEIVKLKDVISGTRVKYIKSTNAFRFGVDGLDVSFQVGADLCYEMFSMRGTLDFQYKWSTGYVVKDKRDVSELGAMRNQELDMLGGRRFLMGESGLLSCDDDFDILCVIQYLYVVSSSVLDRIKHCRRGWYELRKRSLGRSGRKVGSKNSKSSDSEEESLDELLLRVAHNKKVAIEKGFYTWYKEACEEEAKALGKKLDKVEMLVQWTKEREKLES